MEWLYLFGAICFEVLGTTCMKLSEGYTKLIPSVGVVVNYAICFALLTLSLKKIELSVAYAIWAGLGTAIIAGVGIVCFQENVSSAKIISLALIIAGVIGLNLAGHATTIK